MSDWIGSRYSVTLELTEGQMFKLTNLLQTNLVNVSLFKIATTEFMKRQTKCIEANGKLCLATKHTKLFTKTLGHCLLTK